jgi:hypothetical protein
MPDRQKAQVLETLFDRGGIEGFPPEVELSETSRRREEDRWGRRS